TQQPVFAISAVAQQNLGELLQTIWDKLDELGPVEAPERMTEATLDDDSAIAELPPPVDSPISTSFEATVPPPPETQPVSL
ncbi:MAG: hypothetical protein AAFO87_02030, partial [Cyanobacteria bacterium J06607_6]